MPTIGDFTAPGTQATGTWAIEPGVVRLKPTPDVCRKVLERFRYVTLVECKLETGRTHQIRVHMQYTGHPLFNDADYGGDRVLKGTTFTKYKQFVENCFRLLPRQALHARTLEFAHPLTGKRMKFESPLPADMQAVLEKWRTYTNAKPLEDEGEAFDAEAANKIK